MNRNFNTELSDYQKERDKLLKKIENMNKVLSRELAKAPDDRYQNLLKFLREEIDKHTYALDTLNAVFTGLEEALPSPSPKNIMLPKFFQQLKTGEIHLLLYGGLGDNLCATPALRALRKKYPSHKIRISLIPEQSAAGEDSRTTLFIGNPNIDSVHTWGVTNAPHLQKVNVSVGGLGCDIYYRVPSAEIIAGALGLELDSTKPDIFLTQPEIENAQIRLKGDGSKKPLVALGVTSRQPSNQDWPLERWQQLIAMNRHLTFIQLGLPEEPKVQGAVDYRMTEGLRESIALLHCADLYAGMDTFWSHASSAVDTPGVVLFGGTHPSVFSHPNQKVLYKNFSCSPCHDRLKNRPCPYNARCTKEISVEDVSASIGELLAKTQCV